MKIVLLGHKDIASLVALDRLIGQAPDHDYVVFHSGPMRPRSGPSPTLDALDSIDRALFDRYQSEARHPGLLKSPAALTAPNSPEGVSVLRDESPDLIVSIRYRRILKEDAIAVPKFGVLNLHSGILPDYRGVMATFWAMRAREPEIGTTLHRVVDAGIDTGPVIAVNRQPADYSSTSLSNVVSLYRDGCDSLSATIANIERFGRLDVREQDSSAGKYFGAPGESDAQAFEDSGLRLADGREIHVLSSSG